MNELGALLGRGGIGASRRDAILKTVLAQVKAESSAPRRWRWPVVALGTASLVAAVSFLLVPLFSQPSFAPFRAKGTAAKALASTPAVAIECLGATPDACPKGSLLVVRVSGVRGYVSAWAEPVGEGERIWYFSADTYSPLVDGISNPSTATTRVVRIGPEHFEAAYVVDIRVTDREVRREEVLHIPASAVLASGRVALTVISP
jgi:hypothetical protein